MREREGSSKGRKLVKKKKKGRETESRMQKAWMK